MLTKSRRRNHNEILLSNRVDSAFNRMMFPLNVLQQIMFIQKYRIRDKFITSNDNIINLVCFCGLICIVMLNAYNYCNIETEIPTLFKITTFTLELVIIPTLLLFNFTYTIRYCNTHVRLFLKLQRLARFTKYSKYKDFTVHNWIGVVVLVGYHVVLVIIWYGMLRVIIWSFIILLLIHSYIYYVSRYVNLLRRNVVLWTDNIKQMDKYRTTTEEELEINQAESCAELFNYFKDILEAFSIVKRTYEFMVRLKPSNHRFPIFYGLQKNPPSYMLFL